MGHQALRNIQLLALARLLTSTLVKQHAHRWCELPGKGGPQILKMRADFYAEALREELAKVTRRCTWPAACCQQPFRTEEQQVRLEHGLVQPAAHASNHLQVYCTVL